MSEGVSLSGIITTVAGDGSYGFSGDGVPATSAQLNGAIGVAVDNAGNLFISDHHNNRIRKVSASGIISTVAGDGTRGFSGDNGPAASAQLTRPWGVAVVRGFREPNRRGEWSARPGGRRRTN